MAERAGLALVRAWCDHEYSEFYFRFAKRLPIRVLVTRLPSPYSLPQESCVLNYIQTVDACDSEHWDHKLCFFRKIPTFYDKYNIEISINCLETLIEYVRGPVKRIWFIGWLIGLSDRAEQGRQLRFYMKTKPDLARAQLRTRNQGRALANMFQGLCAALLSSWRGHFLG